MLYIKLNKKSLQSNQFQMYLLIIFPKQGNEYGNVIIPVIFAWVLGHFFAKCCCIPVAARVTQMENIPTRPAQTISTK